MSSISATMILDSVSPQGHRLRTFQICAHRFILAEINTHRALSRNYRSSRAVPVAKLLEEVRTNPAMPVAWLKNKPGMQATEPMTIDEEKLTRWEWKVAANTAARHADRLGNMGLHKQWTNRVIEPFLMVHGVISGTDFNNFYALRRHQDAQPEFKALADAMWECEQASTPKLLSPGQWHLPYVTDADYDAYNVDPLDPLDGDPDGIDLSFVMKHSVARIARVSYSNHDGTAPDLAKDLKLHDMLLASGHMSPFEHQATPDTTIDTGCFGVHGWEHQKQHGNLTGFRQYRKMISNEHVPG